jgi:hypothetical protein
MQAYLECSTTLGQLTQSSFLSSHNSAFIDKIQLGFTSVLHIKFRNLQNDILRFSFTSVIHIKFRNLLNTQTETSSKVHQFYTCPEFQCEVHSAPHASQVQSINKFPFFSLIYIFSSLAAEHQKQITLRSKLVYRMNMILNMTHVTYRLVSCFWVKNTLKSKPI